MKRYLNMALIALMAVGTLHSAIDLPPVENDMPPHVLGGEMEGPEGKEPAVSMPKKAFLTDRLFYRRAFEKPGEMAKRMGPKGRKGWKRGKRKGKKWMRWGWRRRGFFRKAKMAKKLKVKMTEKQRKDWDALAVKINDVVKRAEKEKKAIRKSIKKGDRKKMRKERKKHKKMLHKQLSKHPDFKKIRKNKREAKKEKRKLKRAFIAMARKHVGASKEEKEKIKKQMVEFKSKKLYPAKKKFMEAKCAFHMLKLQFFVSEASMPMVEKAVEKAIKRAERRKNLWPLRKEYRNFVKQLYEVYKRLPFPPAPKKKPAKPDAPKVEKEKEEVETLEEAEAAELEEVLPEEPQKDKK